MKKRKKQMRELERRTCLETTAILMEKICEGVQEAMEDGRKRLIRDHVDMADYIWIESGIQRAVRGVLGITEEEGRQIMRDALYDGEQN